MIFTHTGRKCLQKILFNKYLYILNTFSNTREYIFFIRYTFNILLHLIIMAYLKLASVTLPCFLVITALPTPNIRYIGALGNGVSFFRKTFLVDKYYPKNVNYLLGSCKNFTFCKIIKIWSVKLFLKNKCYKLSYI